MNKITPGPWAIYYLANDVETYGDNANCPIITADNDETEICGVIDNPADARLISAAPDLLASLKELLPMWESGIQEPWVIRAKAVIAKAEGKEEQA